MRQAGLRCPICGNGVLADIAYDEHHPPVDPPKQAPESGEVVTFTCGHEVEVGRLADAARDDPNVERRTSDDVVDPGTRGRAVNRFEVPPPSPQPEPLPQPEPMPQPDPAPQPQPPPRPEPQPTPAPEPEPGPAPAPQPTPPAPSPTPPQPFPQPEPSPEPQPPQPTPEPPPGPPPDVEPPIRA